MEFKNLMSKIKKEIDEKEKKFIKEIKEGKTPYITKAKTEKGKIRAVEKWKKKKLKEKEEFLKRVAEAEDLKKPLIINVVWTKNRTWGYTAKATTSNGKESGIISGCGYDKLSTATARVLNQELSILKELFKIKNKKENINKTNREVFGYGLNYGILPCFAGGVGFNCHKRILENIGFKVEHSGTKTTDIIIIYK